MAKRIKANPIEEAKRYIENAKNILQEKGEIDNDGYFSDKKYMKMAGHIAYSGILVALDVRLCTLKMENQKKEERMWKNLSK